MFNQITAIDIEDWAKKEPRRAQEILPELIVKLILATSTKIEDFNFPIEKGIQFAGYDGVLSSRKETNFFPKGKSVWEFGTTDDAMGKFKKDIKKRHKEPLGVNISDTVFIFATLKFWHHKTSIEELITESKQNYKWKDIQIIDASKIKLWIEQCPAVAVWFSKIIGRHIKGILSLDAYWEDCCSSTKPKLTEDFFLIKRESQIEELTNWLKEGKGYRILKAESALEARLFIIAVVRSMPADKRENIFSRSIIVESSSAWEEIIGKADNNTILIPIFNFTEDIRCPVNITAILPVSKFSPISKISKNIDTIQLQKYSAKNFQKSLEILGITISDYSILETKTKRFFSPFYREIQTIPTKKEPKWATDPKIKELIPAMIAGSWCSGHKGDKSIIEILSGKSYEEYEKILNDWITREDAPIFNVSNTVQVVSVQDLWNFLFEKITKEDIARLKDCVLTAFKVIDPAFELPREQWFMARIFGKNMEYSYLILQGIIISLIMLSENDDADNNFGEVSTNSWVDYLIKEVLTAVNTWQHWNTIAPSLQLLAEASPRAVVEKLEQEINNENSEIWHLFTAPKDSVTDRSYYTYILWALENLVWYKDYVVRAIMLFAKIEEKNFEYKMVNSPFDSLYKIFCLWYPQSCLNYKDRMPVIEKICDTYPSTGWHLLNRLLLSVVGGFSMDISKPKWRNDANVSPIQITQKEYDDSLKHIILLCISKLSNDVNEWCMVITNIKVFEQHFDRLEEKCIEACKTIPEAKVLLICGSLRERISSFRQFPDSGWSVLEEYVCKLENLLLKITPNTIFKYSYLFQSFYPHVLNPTPHKKDFSSDYNAKQQNILELQDATAHTMIKEYGVNAFLNFCETAKDVRVLNKIIVDTILKNQYDFGVLKKIKSSNPSLYSSMLWNLFDKNGIDILLGILTKNDSLTAEEKGDILCHTPLSAELWEKINLFEDAIIDYYWEHVGGVGIYELDDKSFDYYLAQLLKYNQPFSVIKIISCSKYYNTERIIEALWTCVQLQEQIEKGGASIALIQPCDFINLFNKIYENMNVDENIVIFLEKAFLSYLKFENKFKPKYLIRHLEKNPEYLVSLISKVCEPDVITESEHSEINQSEIKMACEILYYFKKIPGCNNEIISEEIFLEWIDKAQKSADELGYTKAFKIYIGKLLSYAPIGTDGIFPHEIVRNYFEKNIVETIKNQFVTERRNQRGAYCGSGGMNEKAIAKQYKDDAAKLRINYPHTSAILLQLGDCYSNESCYEEQREDMNFY